MSAEKIGVSLKGEWTLTPDPRGGFTMVLFGCGRSYIGFEDEVGPAIKRHHESGCKKCRRYQRRMERFNPGLGVPFTLPQGPVK